MEAKMSFIERLKDFFSEDGWKAETCEDIHTLRMKFKGKSGSWLCEAKAYEIQGKFAFYSIQNMVIEEARKIAALELVNLINSGMLRGNFEIYFPHNEVRFRTSIDCEGPELDFTVIRKAVYINIFTFDKYLPVIKDVVFSGLCPKAALDKL